MSEVGCQSSHGSGTAARRLKFLTRVLCNYASNRRCPYCNSSRTRLLGRKKYVLQLRKCAECELQFRWPKETSGFLERFYQGAYKEGGSVTDLPDEKALAEFIATGFVGSPRDASKSIEVLKKILPNGRVLDFGCSWGYGVYQLNRAGYSAVGFEISRGRAEQGRRVLGVEIIDSFTALNRIPDSSFEGIYASHVLEHLQSLKEVFVCFHRILALGGVAMILVPNCGGREARRLRTSWGPMINEKHTLALTGEFFLKNMPQFGFRVRVLTDPYDEAGLKLSLSQAEDRAQDGNELMVLATKIS